MTNQARVTDEGGEAGHPPTSVQGDKPREGGPTRRLDISRGQAVAIWAALFLGAFLAFGLPTDPGYAFIWLWALAVAWRIDRPVRSHLSFARDWLPVVALLTVYNLTRGFADGIRAPHVTELIDADLAMFGWATGDKIPTVWLQQNLYDPTRVQWWEVLVSYVYFSHFVAALGIAVALWLTSRPQWASFMRRWFVLSFAGLTTYFLYPAAPPWWAAANGYLEPVERLSLRGGAEFGMHSAFSIIRLGQLASNPVAAIPSLHTAFALFVVLFFVTRIRKRYAAVLLLYPLAMTFTLVYSGEHYVIDVLIGWAYALGTFALVGLAERWWRQRQRPSTDADADGGNARGSRYENSRTEQSLV
jgi:hypothetical protein